MAHREVSGLQWAVPCARPGCIPRSRPRGAKAAGLRYERELAKALPQAKHGQWWEFRDARGRGFCQTDLLLPLGTGTLVLEAKYTWTPEGHSQLERLYLPVVRKAGHSWAVGVVVCRALLPSTPREAICGSLGEAYSRAALGLPAVLHWFSGSLKPQAEELMRCHLAPARVAA